MTLEEWQKAYPYIANKSTGIGLGAYEDARRTFGKMWSSTNPAPIAPPGSFNFSPMAWDQGGTPTPADYEFNKSYDDWERAQAEAWSKMLTPEQIQEHQGLKHDSYKKHQRMGQMAFLAAAGAMAAPGILGAMGSAGGSGTGALGAAGGDLGMAGWMGTGAGPMGVEAGAAGLAGGGAGAGGAMSGEYLGPLLDSLGSGGGWAGGMPSGVDLGALGGIMQTGGSSNGWLGKLLGGILGGGQQQGGGIGNLLGTGGLGLLSQYYNNSKMPGIPDFMKLAQMTGASANPNQTNAQGDSLNWAVDPATGQRTQTVKYGASNQKAFDEQQAMAQALRSKIMTRPAAAPMQQVDLSNLWG
jgi:hypothetical protein